MLVPLRNRSSSVIKVLWRPGGGAGTATALIQRQGDGFPVDQCCVAYLRYLRRGRQQSPRTEADAPTSRSKPRCYNHG
jgi:hypothetical protein